MIAGVLLGTLMLATAAVLIGGAFNTARLDAVEWPGDGSGAPEKSVPAAIESSPATGRPTRSVAPVVPATPAPRRTATPTRSRSQTPVARQSTSPAATPASKTPTTAPPASAPPTTDAERIPPGQTKEPRGLGSDKTHGPKN